jgi:ribosomal protein L37AE/L43A
VFWYCLAHLRHPELRLDRLATKAKDLYKDYYKISVNKNYPGMDIQGLDKIEDYFGVNIHVYRFNGKKALMERHSEKSFDSTLSLNIYSDLRQNHHHFSYIINLSQLTKVFQCPECHSFFSEFKKIKRHHTICKKPKIVFEDGNYQPKLNVFENLGLNAIHVPQEMRFYPYFIYFDF